MKNEQADAGRDGRTRLAKPYPVDPHSAICNDHTYIHTANNIILLKRTTDYCTSAALRSYSPFQARDCEDVIS